MACMTDKYATRSGNTFRKGNPDYLRKYRRNAFIVCSNVGDYVREDDTFQTMGVMGEDESMTDGFECSLNKQNRCVNHEYKARAIDLDHVSKFSTSKYKGKGHLHRKRRCHKSYIQEQMELVDDLDLFDEDMYDFMYDLQDHYSLDDLKAARNSHKLQFQQEDYVESVAHFLEEWTNGEGNDTHFDNSNKSHVNVILQNDDIHTADLRQRYGNAFIECRCYPRKFVVNISKKLQECIHRLYETSRTLREGAYLVFVNDVNNDVNTQEQPIYKVSLHYLFNDKPIESEAVNTLFDYMYAGVDEIVNNTLFYLETLPVENQLDITNSGIEQYANPGVVEHTYKWYEYTSTYQPNNYFLLNDFLDVDNSSNKLHNDVTSDIETIELSDNFVSPNDNACSICCDVIDETFPGTSLRICAHWFCNTCWTQHITSRINNSRGLVQCPAYGCNVDVDAGTLMTLVDFRCVLKYASLCHDNVVAREKDRVWCPNVKCDLVLEVNTVDANVVHCRCGTKLCVQCLNRAHWPADCNSVKQHNKKLHKTGDMALIKTVVYTRIYLYGKECPWCHRFMEKNGGCPNVQCVCGKAFCWGCNLPWKQCTHSSYCNKHGMQNRHDTKKIYLSSYDLGHVKKEIKFYKLALNHRLNQNPSKTKMMTKAMKPMLIHMRLHLLCSYGTDTSLDFTSGNKVYARECDKVKDYLTSIVDLYIETNQVIENSAILLSSWDIIDEDGIHLHNEIKVLAKISEELFDFVVHTNVANTDARILIDNLKRARSNIFQKLQAFLKYYDSICS